MTAVPSSHRHDLTTIQCTRGIAAWLIVLFHAIGRAAGIHDPDGPIRVLMAGVDIFFVMSGFIMVYATGRSPQRTAARFWLDRVTRIVPLYWLLTLLVVGIGIGMPQFLHSGRIEAWHAVASFLFLPARHPVTHYYDPVLIPGWSLNYEMFFYLLFGLGMMVARGRLAMLCMVVGGAIAAAVLFGKLVAPPGVAAFYTAGIMMEFVFGMALGLAYVRGMVLSARMAVLACLCGVIALGVVAASPPVLPREVEFGLPALSIVAGALFLQINVRSRVVAFLRRLGDASYSLYLSHPLGVSAVAVIWGRTAGFGSRAGQAAFVVVAVVACIAAALFLYRWVERPLTDRLRGAGDSTRRPAVSGA